LKADEGVSILSFHDPIVISGIGLITAVGHDRESVWTAIQRGDSGVRSLKGLECFSDDLLIGATVDLPGAPVGALKSIQMMDIASDEALADAGVTSNNIDGDRVAVSTNGHMGDLTWFYNAYGEPGYETATDPSEWKGRWLPNSSCSYLGAKHKFYGPRLVQSTACASSLIGVISAMRAIDDGQCDAALVGGGEVIEPLMAAGFRQMRALAEDDTPERACRPFDRTRKGFVMGEGAGMLFIEKASSARSRGAKIYAELLSGLILSDAHHVTGVDADSDTLPYLIRTCLEKAELDPHEVGYVNAHGTGTWQNDKMEIGALRKALGGDADSMCVSSVKPMIGHLIGASGSVELGITALAMRDGFSPPTINLRDQDPACDMDCLPLIGRTNQFQHAIKLAVAFGGHLAAVALRRWNHADSGYAYPVKRKLAA